MGVMAAQTDIGACLANQMGVAVLKTRQDLGVTLQTERGAVRLLVALATLALGEGLVLSGPQKSLLAAAMGGVALQASQIRRIAAKMPGLQPLPVPVASQA